MEKGSGGIVEWGSAWGAACVEAEFPTVCTLYKFNIRLPGLLYVLRRIKRNPPKLDFPEKHTPASQSPQWYKNPSVLGVTHDSKESTAMSGKFCKGM